MRRGLWFVAGAGAGVYVTARARRLKEAFTVEGLRDRWEAMTLGARLLRDDVAQAQADKETELRERFGLAPHGLPELTASRGLVPSETPRHSAPQGPTGKDGMTRPAGDDQEGTD